jgi:uncharacterized DUF497 family protein
MLFEWDKGNINKILKRFPIEEIETFFQQELMVISDPDHSQIEDRFIAVGISKASKPMFVCFTIRNAKIRVISARFMRPKEAAKYEKFKEAFKN